MTGFAKDISISKQDDIWIVSEDKVHGGYEVYRSKFSIHQKQEELNLEWESMGIAAVRISALSDDAAVIVNEWGEVYATKK